MSSKRKGGGASYYILMKVYFFFVLKVYSVIFIHVFVIHTLQHAIYFFMRTTFFFNEDSECTFKKVNRVHFDFMLTLKACSQ